MSGNVGLKKKKKKKKKQQSNKGLSPNFTSNTKRN